MSVAIAVSFDRLQMLSNVHHITTAVVLAVLINEVIGPWMTQFLLGERRKR